jgi:hypothetical protein
MEWMGLTGSAAFGSRLLGAGRVLYAEAPAGSLSPDAGSQAGKTRWEISAQRKNEIAKDVTWFSHEPLDFHLRRGNHPEDEPDVYAKMIEPDNIKRMAATGAVWGRIFFYKGFGLEYERPHIEQAKNAAALMHSLGMRVSVYVAGTMFTETLYQEVPEARDWEQRDCWGHWVSYGIQTFRHYPCINQPGYEGYMRRVIKVAVEEVQADDLSFDQIMLEPEPRSCRCTRCLALFAEFLKKRYTTTEAVHRRFGLPSVDWIRVNEWEFNEQPDALAEVLDPVLQEWTRFRCESLARHGGDMYEYAKSLNPKVVVNYNMKGVFSFNRYWRNAVYHPLFNGHVDCISFDTGGYGAHIDPVTGALISQIRSYKVARRIGAASEESGFVEDDLRAAVFMAYNYQKKSNTTPPQLGPGTFNVFTPIMEFFREYADRYLTQTEPVADVAVLRNWPSMAYSISGTYIPVTLMEQVLIQYKVPFDLLFDDFIETIDLYAAVIMAGQECVSKAQAELLVKYVRNGGVLIVIGDSGKFNEWREERETNPLLPPRREGKGQIIHLPEILRADSPSSRRGEGFEDPEPGATPHRGVQISPPQWVLPRNHKELHQSIVDALPGGPSITTEAPLTVVAEMFNRASTRETIVHFINFDQKNKAPAFRVTMRKQTQGAVKTVTCLTPASDAPIKLAFTDANNVIGFSVPSFAVYAMVIVA